MEKGSIVLVSYIGKELSTGMVFDTTEEEVAKKNGIYRKEVRYGPVPIVIGDKDIVEGIDEELESMKEGEERTIKLGPKKAFGERNSDLIYIVPLNAFLKNKIRPYVGMPVEINGNIGRVQSISGGRVRVDFNHSLAGKEVEYYIKIVKELKTTEEKFKALLEKYLPLKDKPSFEIKEKEAVIKLKKELPKELDVLKEAFGEIVKKKIKDIEKVSFVIDKNEEENVTNKEKNKK
ncbi:MAG: peptidylprolyl isomerase [Candidatus Diapherotrites archaeon]|nr:peptidylprolyl isomerase [Candidatus Diapherotrites archaeon]